MSKLALTKKYGAYPKYKDSGVDWFGEIPKDWQVKISKRLFREINLRGESNLELASVTQNNGVVLRSSSNLSVWNPGDNISGYKTIKNGQFVLSLRSFEGGVELSNINALVSPAYTVMALNKKCDKNYFRWLLKSDNIISALQIYTRGIRQGKNISFNDFSKIYLTIPDFTGQKKIADFLDEKTATIDNIIEKKKQQIELLKEKRAATINHAVTKGLDPKAKFVGSDIEWLGDTPIDWKCMKIKMVVKTTQSGVWGDEPKNNDKDIKCLRVADFDYEYLTTVKPETIRNNPKISSTKVLQDGDILFEKSGGGEKTPVGRAVLYTGEGGVTCANFIDIIRVDKEQIIPDYLVFFLAALYDGRLNTKYIKQNTGIQNIKVNSYFEEQIPLPTIDEQKEIVIKLKKYLEQERLIESKLKESIKLLQEFKSSLISHAVTGKIKI